MMTSFIEIEEDALSWRRCVWVHAAVCFMHSKVLVYKPTVGERASRGDCRALEPVLGSAVSSHLCSSDLAIPTCYPSREGQSGGEGDESESPYSGKRSSCHSSHEDAVTVCLLPICSGHHQVRVYTDLQIHSTCDQMDCT
jgi:hypothetical protein